MKQSMKTERPYTFLLDQIRSAGLRPTRQRLALAKLLFDGMERHVTAEMLHGEAQAARVPVSLATVYNTLHQFTDAGLLKEIMVDSGRSYFDTNTLHHHHFYCETSGELSDIDGADVAIDLLPSPPHGKKISTIDVIIRIQPN